MKHKEMFFAFYKKKTKSGYILETVKLTNIIAIAQLEVT